MPILAEPFPKPASLGARDERVLLVLTAQERRAFFTGPAPAELFPSLCREADPAASRLSASEWEKMLREYRPTVLVSAWNTPPLPSSWLAEPDLPLRYVCHVTGSVRGLLPRALLVRGIAVSNWGGLASHSVAEHGLLLALAALRNLAAWPAAIRNSRAADGGSCTTRLGTRSLFGRRVGIHGFGQVARSLIRLLQPFGVAICVFAEGVPPELIRQAGAGICTSLPELCAHSEVFFECEALTPARVGSVDAAALAALPDRAVFVNIARGPLIDEKALRREAVSGRIRIALDVVADDPVRPTDPLTDALDGVFSPHISGPTQDWFPRCGEHALANLRRYLAGEPLESVVTAEIYDRST